MYVQHPKNVFVSGKLLERNTEMGISFVDYFKEIEKISDLTPVYILDVSNCEVLYWGGST